MGGGGQGGEKVGVEKGGRREGGVERARERYVEGERETQRQK